MKVDANVDQVEWSEDVIYMVLNGQYDVAVVDGENTRFHMPRPRFQ